MVLQRHGRWLAHLVGPVATVVSAMVLEFIGHLGYPIPGPGAVLMLAVALGAYSGGVRSGLACAAILAAYLFGYGTHGSVFASPDFTPRASIITGVSVVMALLMGGLKCRSDLLGRRRVETATEQSARRFAMLFESAPVGIAISRSGVLLHANPALLRIFGYESADDLAGRSLDVLLAPAVRREVIDRTARRERGEEVVSTYETTGLRRDGREFPFSVHAVRLSFPEGPATVAFIADISERRDAERAVLQLNRDLHQRVSELQTLLDVLPAGVTLASDPQCASITANGYIRRLLGIAQEQQNISVIGPEAASLPFVLLRDGKPIPAGEQPMQRAARVGASITNEEIQVVRRDGTRIDLLANVSPLFDEHHQIRGALGTFIDIGPMKRAQEALRDREAATEFSLASANVGSWQLDFDNMELSCSDICKANFGRRRDESFTFTDAMESIHPQDRAAVDRAVRSAVRSRTTFEAEYRALWPDGSVHWIIARGNSTTAADGRPLRMAGITVDVTDRKHAEEELRLSRERLKLAVDGAGLGTWYRDLPSNKMVWNDRCREHLGLDSECEITQEMFLNLIHPEDRDRVNEAIERAIAQRGIYDVDYRTVAPDGRLRWIRAIGRCSYDAAGRPTRFDGITTDQTEQKRVEQELDAARKSAETASAAKDQFLAVLSHELRTPLTPVLTTVQALESDQSLGSDVLDSLAMIRRNVELEARLIDDLLDLTRIARDKLRLELQSLDAHELLRQAIDICSPELIRKKLRLKIELSASRRHVRADPARLQQVYWNLINNAMKFTAPGGQITIRSRNEGHGCIAVDIADTGIGIDPAILPRLFVPFEQGEVSASRRFGGLGLGLAISRRLVEMHEGRLTAASDGPGKGACFTVRLNTIEPRVEAPAPAPPALPEAQSAGVRILLVDDHEDTNRAMRRLLERWGYKVACAYSVESALQAASGEPFDLLISDIGLPDGSGLELMRQLLAQPRPKPLRGIALSGFGMDDDIRKSREAGFHDHLTKPVSFEKLQTAICDAVKAQ